MRIGVLMKTGNTNTAPGKGCARIFLIAIGGLAAAFVALIVVALIVDQIQLSQMKPADRAKYIAERDARYAREHANAKAMRDKEKAERAKRLAAKAQADNPPAVVKIQTVFRGGDSPEQTKSEVDEVLTLYDQPLTEEAYKRFGNIVAYQAEHHLTVEMKIVRCMKAVKTSGSPVVWTIERAAGFCATGKTLPNFDAVFAWDSPVCEYISDVDKAINLSQTGNFGMVEAQTSCFYVPKKTPAISLDSAGYDQQVIIIDDQGQLRQLWTESGRLLSRH